MAELRLERLGKRFGPVEAVRDVSLTTAADEFLVLLGPSGCGKTTVLRMLAGLLDATTGRIRLDGRDITHAPPKERDLAMVFQNYALYPHMSVARNIAFSLRLQRRPRDEIRARVDEAAEMLGLGDLLDRKPKELSGGQRQRVALGRAIVRQPKAFLMDEPLSNLDAKLRTATRGELTDLHRRLGTTFVYVTHDQVEAMTMATRVAVMNEGRLEQVGTPTEVFDTPATTFVAGFIGSPPMNLLPAEIVGEHGTLVASAPGVRAPLWPGAIEPRDVVLGVRPEHLHPLADDHGIEPADVPRLRGDVLATENHGSEEVARCRVGGRELAVRGERPLGLTPGSSVTLTCDPARVCLFDADSGRRLVWERSPEPGADHRAAATDRTAPTDRTAAPTAVGH
ncbi:MAG: ABC transporter ATP-binding protein [Actinomycetota bacterium]|nr:ABC transporter ATP-binding protein [Actinomycetota bacterium]